MSQCRSTSITADASGVGAVLSVLFEDDGYEIYGNCVDHVLSAGMGHMWVHRDDAKLRIIARIGAADGRLVTTDIGATFIANFAEVGPCHENFWAFVCDLAAPDRESLFQRSTPPSPSPTASTRDNDG